MKNKIFSIAIAVITVFLLASCRDYLEVDSPSVVDSDFLMSNLKTAESVLLGAYTDYKTADIWMGGKLYYQNGPGSDIEHFPENSLAFTCYHSAYFYPEGTESWNINANTMDHFASTYAAIDRCNTIINAVEKKTNFKEIMSGEANDWSDLYGQAIAIRATCYEIMVQQNGDVPYVVDKSIFSKGTAVSRFFTLESMLEQLKAVEPHMYRLGENGHKADLMTRTYVQALIARICLDCGGYQLLRTDAENGFGDAFYTDIKGNKIAFDVWGTDESRKCKYARRSDWKDFYKIADTYLASCIAQPGTAKLVTVDNRPSQKFETTNGTSVRTYDNPYQLIFQDMMDLKISDESIYEIPEVYGVLSDFTYAYGRGSGGGGSNSFPNKAYGEIRFQIPYYYEWFDNNDKRRDVTATVTASTGKGSEMMCVFTPGSRQKGGICLNKWDENRLKNHFIASQRKSGVNRLLCRFADVLLMYAEVENVVGSASVAKEQLSKIRERAFGSAELANVDGFIAKCGSLEDAILTERALEFGGEGYRRTDLLRTGKFPQVVKTLRDEMTSVISDLKTKGYHTFSNGNQISNFIWIKNVDAKKIYGYRLTTGSTNVNDPVLYPGWRGQCDSWEDYGCAYANTNTNIAIKGLFKYIDPDGPEAAALEAEGYVKTEWGVDLYADYNVSTGAVTANATNQAHWSTYMFSGLTDDMIANHKAFIYLSPYSSTVTSTTELTNGFGFPQQ